MLQSLVGKIADLWNAPDAWIAAEIEDSMPPVPEDEPAPGSAELFRRRFIELAGQRQRANGRVVSAMLSIAWQGSRLGAHGSRYRDLKVLTEMVTDLVLEQMAGKPDFYLAYDTDNAVLCFASANRAIVELRGAMMAQALVAALVQRMPDLAGKVRVEVVVTEVEPVDVVTRGTDLAVALVDALCRARDNSALGRLSFGLSA